MKILVKKNDEFGYGIDRSYTLDALPFDTILNILNTIDWEGVFESFDKSIPFTCTQNYIILNPVNGRFINLNYSDKYMNWRKAYPEYYHCIKIFEFLHLGLFPDNYFSEDKMLHLFKKKNFFELTIEEKQISWDYVKEISDLKKVKTQLYLKKGKLEKMIDIVNKFTELYQIDKKIDFNIAEENQGNFLAYFKELDTSFDFEKSLREHTEFSNKILNKRFEETQRKIEEEENKKFFQEAAELAKSFIKPARPNQNLMNKLRDAFREESDLSSKGGENEEDEGKDKPKV